MIKKLTLLNFQIHRRLELEFDKRFTVIIGGNNRGKSSIIRAINWVFYNEPSGDWMRRINNDNELENTKVKILFEDGTLISREKGDKINKYIVDGDEYENFGYGVPEKVLEKLKIYPLKTNKATFNINLSMQDDHPFLIQESAPVKSSIIDSLTGNSIIQRSISEFNKQITNASKEQSLLEQTISEDESTIANMPDIKNIESLLEEVVVMEKDLKDEQVKLERLIKIVGDIAIQKTKINSYVEIDLEKLQKLIKRLDDNFEECEELRVIEVSIKANNKKIVDIPSLEGLEDIIDKLKNNEIEKEKLIELHQAFDDADEILITSKSDLVESEKELEDFIKENPNCPTCGGKWNK